MNNLPILILAACLSFCLVAVRLAAEPTRSPLVFSFANASLAETGGIPYFCLDVMANIEGAEQRLGTVIVYLNYNPQVFGEYVKLNGNVGVERGAILTTSPFPLYNLIVNDNGATRLAVTFEYLFTPGGGSLLTEAPKSLLSFRFSILNPGFASGFSFQQSLMAGEQYQDDNATLFSPVTATDTENFVVPAQPAGLAIALDGGTLSLSWQECPGCVYTVYSAAEPFSAAWQIEATELPAAQWNGISGDERKFFRVTATGLPGR